MRLVKVAKNFLKSNSAFAAAKAAESIMAKADEIKVLDVNLIDAYVDNNEDVSNIDDLVTSMKENGFTDPIEVTNYGCDDGRYMILSGHRRYTAWTTLHNGKQPIKCIVVDAAKFKTAADVKNYVLMANSQRDSAKDPLLLVKRYGEHEKYLNDIGFEGNIRDEIANRLGVSIQQADRYKALGKCIPEIQAMVAEDKLGLSTATYISPLDKADQKKFYPIMLDAIADPDMKGVITRSQMPKMIKYFKMELWTWEAIKAQIKQESIPDISFATPGSSNGGASSETSEKDRNSEVRREFDPIAANADEEDRAQAEYEASQKETSDDNDNASDSNDEDSSSKERKTANDIIRTIKKLDTTLAGKFFDFEDEEAAVLAAKELVNNLEEYIIKPFLGTDK